MFVHDRLANQHTMRMLCVADEHTRECLAIEVDRKLTSPDAIGVDAPFAANPHFIRSDNGAEFTSAGVMRWLPISWLSFLQATRGATASWRASTANSATNP